MGVEFDLRNQVANGVVCVLEVRHVAIATTFVNKA